MCSNLLFTAKMLKKILKCLKKSARSDKEPPVCELNLIIKKLNYDVLRCIFDLLDLKELINCRKVCKTFRSVVDSTRLKELLLSDGRNNDAHWFRPARSAHFRNSIVNSNFWYCGKQATACVLFERLCVSLKFLSLKFKVDGQFLEETVNSFIHLEELWILKLLPTMITPTLILPNLKKFACCPFRYNYQNKSNRSPYLILETPSLTTVRLERNLDLVRFNFAKTVRNLQIDQCERTFELLQQFLELKGLQWFSCTDAEFLNWFNVLEYKPDLKRIDCYRHPSGKQFRVLERLLEHKSKWSLPVEIHYEGELVNHTGQLREWRLRNDSENNF